MAKPRTLLRASLSGALIVAVAGLAAVAPDAHAAGETCVGETATVVGSGVINGTPFDDIIVGSAVADTINGNGGNDIVCGGAGNDRITTAGGDDFVFDGPGADTVSLGSGNDRYYGGTVKDARDVVDAGPGYDGADYRDRTKALKVDLRTTTADDGEIGEADKLLTFEVFTGGSANDKIVGSNDSDILVGMGGNDTINGALGSDLVEGHTGDDVVIEDDSASGDQLFGGDGVDEISYAHRLGAVEIWLSGTEYSGEFGEGDVVYDFENARGGRGKDYINGTSDANKLWGGASRDDIFDGYGADTVDGGPGCDVLAQSAAIDPGDVLIGGTGACDYISYEARTAAVNVNLGTTSAVQGSAGEGDVIKTTEGAAGGAGDDTIKGTGAANVIFGGVGSDVLDGLGGADDLYSYDAIGGNDTVLCGFGSDDVYIDAGDAVTACEFVTTG